MARADKIIDVLVKMTGALALYFAGVLTGWGAPQSSDMAYLGSMVLLPLGAILVMAGDAVFIWRWWR